MTLPWKAGKQPYQIQEDRTARKPGGRAQPNSGRIWSGLRDVRRKTKKFSFLYDNKTTSARSYALSAEEFNLLKRDANRTPPGHAPILQIDFTGDGKVLSLVVIEEGVFDELLGDR